MGKKNYLKFALSLMITMLFFSCSKTENGNVEYIPFQETDDGHWGMISMDGKVLFKDEFKTSLQSFEMEDSSLVQVRVFGRCMMHQKNLKK